MTRRTRQILVAVGLVVLGAWVILTWTGSSTAPDPSVGPWPTGAIGSTPVTFEPTAVASPSP